MKKVLITGASSGIGYDMTKVLYEMGYFCFVVARRKDRLEELKKELGDNIEIIELDLSKEENIYKLHEQVKQEDIDILINNAGFGLFGEFAETSLDKELEMIDTNIKAVHMLTKLFLQDMKKRDSGHILNVASIAAFASGPLMNTYYATKSYVFRLSEGIYQELKKAKSNVKISVLCPGPVKTEFNQVANVEFKTKYLSSMYTAKYGINKMLKGNLIIIPGFINKCVRFFSKIVPDKIVMKLSYKIQRRKITNN